MYDVGNGEEEGDVIVGIKGVPFEKWDKMIVYSPLFQFEHCAGRSFIRMVKRGLFPKKNARGISLKKFGFYLCQVISLSGGPKGV